MTNNTSQMQFKVVAKIALSTFLFIGFGLIVNSLSDIAQDDISKTTIIDSLKRNTNPKYGRINEYLSEYIRYYSTGSSIRNPHLDEVSYCLESIQEIENSTNPYLDNNRYKRIQRFLKNELKSIKDNKELTNDIIVFLRYIKYIKAFSAEQEFDSLSVLQNIIIDESELSGKITYSIPDTMLLGQSYKIEMVISDNINTIPLLNKISTFTNKRYIVSEKIPIANKMKAILIDPSPDTSFFILPITNQIQEIGLKSDTYTLWQWNITPLRQSKKTINLSVEILLNNTLRSIPIFDKKILIVTKQYLNYRFMVLGSIIILLIATLFYWKTMIKNNKGNSTSWIYEVKELLKNNMIMQALDLLDTKLKSIDKERHKQIIMHKARFSLITEQLNMNIISNADAQINYSQITYAILNLVEMIEKKR